MGGSGAKQAVALGVQWGNFKAQVDEFFSLKYELADHGVKDVDFSSGILDPAKVGLNPKDYEEFRGFLKHVFSSCLAENLFHKGTGCTKSGEKMGWSYDQFSYPDDSHSSAGRVSTASGRKYDRYSKTVASSKNEDGTVREEIIVNHLVWVYNRELDGTDKPPQNEWPYPIVSVICVSHVRMIRGQRFAQDEVIFERRSKIGGYRRSGDWDPSSRRRTWWWRWRSGMQRTTVTLRRGTELELPSFKLYPRAQVDTPSTTSDSAFTDLHPVELAASEWVWHGVAATGFTLFILVLIYFFFYRYAAAAAAAATPPRGAGSAVAGSSLENGAGDHDEQHHNKNYGSTSSKDNPFLFYFERADDDHHSRSDAEHESSSTASRSNETTADHEGAARLSAVKKRACHAKNLKKLAADSSKDELSVDDDQPDLTFGRNDASSSVVGAEIRECQSAARPRQRVLPSRTLEEAGSETF
ncbi:unnamed protein product [Amoebophrya sp. A25]|nr:unnamed protein product [Amoebophrya sp. A25]|eukprot:GSA25T00026500001.1